MAEEAPAATEAPVEEYHSAALNARELEWAENPPEVLKAHKERNGPICRTRFPPEPNGYLHIGHAKSMNMNFSLAFEKLGVPLENRRTIFRYDDTNPDAESAEYIDSLRRDVEWMGWTPERTTYSSDNFGKLYDFAVTLVKKGLAYVCDMSKPEMEAQRELAFKRSNARSRGLDPDVEAPIPSPDILPGRNRDTPVERNLEMLEKMKMGFYPEGKVTLRLKMDFESPNPNMYDLVAYRVKYTPHPHAGNGWCIYPSYDFTHGICDSLEDIDYSICTLEFETRREPYYWILHALDLFRPAVYEMSRLNLQYTVLSKRKLIKLVDTGTVRGWDDPRMPTVSGLRRRGYTSHILNTFCNDVGATRAANLVEVKKLEQTARLALAGTTRRAMIAMDPIKINLTNYEEELGDEGPSKMTFEVQNNPTDTTSGSHTITLTKVIYLDSTDFRLVDSKEYYGLAPDKAVGLKYHGGNMVCDKVIKDEAGKVTELYCHLDNSPDRKKPKTYLSWVPSDSLPCELRVYNNLFTVPEPSDLWEDEINPESEVVYPKALIDPSAAEVINVADVDKWKSNYALQLERFGYFVVDYESTFDPAKGEGKIVLNRTVSLKEDKGRVVDKPKVEDNRKRISAEDKAARMQLTPDIFFKQAPEFEGKFSKFDDEGFPTHDADGKEVTKSAGKKLKKELEKHKKQVNNYNKNNSK